MSPRLRLTERDQATVDATVSKVRLLGLRQVADHWWDGDLANARRRLRLLVDVDLLKRITVHARTLPAIDRPIAIWQPNQAAPSAGQVAQALQSRWRRRAVRAQTAYIATARAIQLFGGKGRGELKNPLQATHDLGVAAVWLHLDTHDPELADAWKGEDLMADTRRGEKCPDAFIVEDSGDVRCVIEFGGAYDANRVRAFHRDCSDRATPYQIW